MVAMATAIFQPFNKWNEGLTKIDNWLTKIVFKNITFNLLMVAMATAIFQPFNK